MLQTAAEPITFEFNSGISPEKAERVITALGEEELPSRRVVLRFEGYPYVNAGVGWRIGNSLRRYCGELLEVGVPPLGGDWFRTFTRSCLGDAIAAYAGTISCNGANVTADIKDYYADKTVRCDQNAVVMGELSRGLSVNPEQEDQFRKQFLGFFRYIGRDIRPALFDRDRLQDVVKLTFEAIQNVYDHAGRKPLPEGTRMMSYFLLGYYKTIEGQPDPTGRMQGYGKRLVDLTKRTRTDFVQVCVNDDGVGIAARQAQDPSIYWGPKEYEEKAVVDALTARSSVKLRAQDSRVRGTPGQGYTYIESGLRALHAFAVLRTGRLLAVLDGTDDASEGFTLVPGDFGYVPGTTLELLIPILKEGDGQPSLFPDE